MLSQNDFNSLKYLYVQTCDLVGDTPIEDSLASWEFIVYQYSEKHRKYHNLEHIYHALNEFDSNSHLVPLASPVDRAAVILALFYHDIVYTPGSKDNEMLSAGYAYESLDELGYPSGFCGLVGDLICETTYTQDPQTLMSIHVRDADMGVLSDVRQDYARYAKNTRLEYSMYDDLTYAKGRRDFLEKMCEEPQTYWLPASTVLDQAAFNNMNREIVNLNMIIDKLSSGLSIEDIYIETWPNKKDSTTAGV